MHGHMNQGDILLSTCVCKTCICKRSDNIHLLTEQVVNDIQLKMNFQYHNAPMCICCCCTIYNISNTLGGPIIPIHLKLHATKYIVYHIMVLAETLVLALPVV